MSYGNGSVLTRKVRGPKMRITGFPAMEPLCNAFASITATMARKEYDTGINVRLFGYETVRHGDYLGQMRAPSAIYLMRFPLTGGTGLIKAHPRLLGKVLDLSLGGDGSFEDDGGGRPLTQIDLAIYGRFVDLISWAFHDAIVELTGRSAIGAPEKTRFEEQPGMVRIAPDRAEVFSIKLSFFIGGDVHGAGLDFVVPISTLEPLKRDLSNLVTVNEATAALWQAAMRERVLELAIIAEGLIDLGEFSVGELSRLEQGALLELPAGALDSVELRVATVDGPATLARGRLGVKGRHKAVRLVEDPNAEFLEPLRQLIDQA